MNNSTNRSTKEDIERWVEATLAKEKVENCKIEISGCSEKGDGYLGDITFVEASGETRNGPKTFNFVLKTGKKSDELREVMPIRSAFENEIFFYNEILPTFIEFQEEKGVKVPFRHVPKCYNTLVLEDMEVLVLENMKKCGYSLWDKSKPMTSEHIRSVLKLYGEYHAISFALKDQKPEVFQKLTNGLKDMIPEMEAMMQEDADLYKDLIEIAEDKNEFAIAEKALLLEKIAKNMSEWNDRTDPYAVLIHGDCWNNNFMFKYEDAQNTKLSQVCFLDFQISRIASPVCDLSYFFFTCASPEDIQNFDKFMNVYYDSFSDFLRELGSDPLKLFPFEEFMNQWKRFAKMGLSMYPTLIKACLADQEETPDLAEVAESGKGIMESFSFRVKNVEEYARRCFPQMKLAIERHFI